MAGQGDAIPLEQLIAALARRCVTTYLQPPSDLRLGMLVAYSGLIASYLLVASDQDAVDAIESILEGGHRRPTLDDVPAMVARLMELRRTHGAAS